VSQEYHILTKDEILVEMKNTLLLIYL